MFEKIINNIKYAAKNVLYHKSEFASFFIAIFVVQAIFGVVSLCYFNNNNIDYKYASEGYDYHFELINLSDDQYYALVNDTTYDNHGEDLLYTIVEHSERNTTSISNTRHDLKIRLTGTVSKSMGKFEKRYTPILEQSSDGKYSYQYTPIVQYEKNAADNRKVFIEALFVMFLISLFLMSLLFSYRLNHFKFTYGIYMTFGANFKKLVSSSFWEMLLVTLITYIPSCVASFFLAKFIYAGTGAAFKVNFGAFVIVLVFVTAVSTLAVIGPVTMIARSTPVKALSAEDNTNFVSVPRVSSRRIVSRFPNGYLFGNIVRFRRYMLRLIASGVVFSMMFIGGSYFAKLYSEKLNYNPPSFTLSFADGNDKYDDSMYSDLMAIDGVIDVIKTGSVSCGYVKSHVLFDSSDVKSFSGLLNVKIDGQSYKATNSVSFRPLDEGMAKFLIERYDCEGDVMDCVGSYDKVVICDSQYNEKIYTFKPGDKFKIGMFLSANGVPETFESGNSYLRQQLDYNSYSYREYTVGAVIHGMSTGADTPMYLPCVDYSIYSKETSDYLTADIYTDPERSDVERAQIGEKLRDFTYKYDNVLVVDNFAEKDSREEDKNYYRFALVLSWLVLIISPVIWMFAQILFYLKREGEMFVLESFGAIKKEIRRVYLGEGALIALTSGVIYTILSFIVTFFICRLANHTFEEPGFMFSLPLLQYLCGLGITLVAAFTSAFIPFFVYNKKKNMLVRSASSEERI